DPTDLVRCELASGELMCLRVVLPPLDVVCDEHIRPRRQLVSIADGAHTISTHALGQVPVHRRTGTEKEPKHQTTLTPSDTGQVVYSRPLSLSSSRPRI